MHSSRLETRQIEQLVDDLRQAIDFGDDASQKIGRNFRIVECPGLQRFHQCTNRRQWRAQLMRDIRDEITPHLFESAQLRDVAQDDDADSLPGRVEPPRCRLQNQPAHARAGLAAHPLPPASSAPDSPCQPAHGRGQPRRRARQRQILALPASLGPNYLQARRGPARR